MKKLKEGKTKEGEMKNFPWLTIIKKSGIVICEVCKLFNPRNRFVVNYYFFNIK
jgi:hypothetical protein